jgi:hypothetical protein
MRRILYVPLVLLLVLPSVASAQVVDVAACDVLSNPVAYDGKLIRMKGVTAVARFDEFVVEGSGCGSSEGIWLDYPAGTKAKAGPVALLRLQLAKNAPAGGDVPAAGMVTLQRDDQFSQFDSLLATPYKSRALCLGCPRYTVTATLTGRLEGVKSPGLTRDDNGSPTSVAGFGNLNMYRSRLVLQSVSDVVPHEIDYATTAVPGDSRRAKARATGEQLHRGAAAFGGPGEDNGVEVGFGVANEVVPGEFARGTAASPDGILFYATFNMDRLSKSDLSLALAHVGIHLADIRERVPFKDLSSLEDRAWQATFK